MQFIDLKYFPRMCKSPSSMNEEAANEFRENDLCPVNGFYPHIRVPKMRRSIQRQSQGHQLLLLGPISLHGLRPAYLSRKPERYPSLPAGNPVQTLSPGHPGEGLPQYHTGTAHRCRSAKKNGIAAYIDAEHALDMTYAKKIGVNTDELLISQPDTGEQALEIAETLVRSGALDVLVVDSVAALVPKAELEGEMGDAQMGLQARLMSQALRKLTGSISKSKTTVIFINQLRMKIGVFFGNPETTTGGNALKFYSSQRLDIRKMTSIKNGQDVIGFRTRVKVVKNKLAAPFREAEFDIIFGEGISREGDVLDLAAENGIVEKSGAWYSYKGDRLGQGRDNSRIFLKDNPDVLAAVENDVREKLGIVEKDQES